MVAFYVLVVVKKRRRVFSSLSYDYNKRCQCHASLMPWQYLLSKDKCSIAIFQEQKMQSKVESCHDFMTLFITKKLWRKVYWERLSEFGNILLVFWIHSEKIKTEFNVLDTFWTLFHIVLYVYFDCFFSQDKLIKMQNIDKHSMFIKVFDPVSSSFLFGKNLMTLTTLLQNSQWLLIEFYISTIASDSILLLSSLVHLQGEKESIFLFRRKRFIPQSTGWEGTLLAIF